MDAERLLDGLDEAQRRAVTSTAAPLTILAGAGSGKTRVLTRRIAHRSATGDADPRRVLALTFTRKAAGELRSRLRALGLRDEVAAGTFHSVAYAQLRTRWADRGITPPALLDRKVAFVARLVPRDLGRDTPVLDLVTEIEWAKARRVTPDGYGEAVRAAGRRPGVEPARVAEVFAAYEEEKRRARLVDFDDLLRLCRQALVEDDEFARVQRWRFRHLFVDEYQDVNPLQHALLEAWLGGRADSCVVGDPNQAIYAWNGADNRYLLDLAAGRGGGEVIHLTENYRSTPQILAVANAVLAGASAPAGGRAGRRRADAEPALGPLRANRPDGPVPTVRSFADATAEARGIARAVRDAHQPGTAWSSQAVLVRTNAQATTLEEALAEVGIPFRVRGGTALVDQPEVKAVLAELRRGTGAFDVALVDLRTAADAAGEASSDAAGDGADPFAGDAPRLDERRANLLELLRLAHEYAALEAAPNVAGFASWLHQTTRADRPDRAGDAVEIVTFHAAKGLEWPVVHLAGVEQGLVPIGHARTPAELAEERRLFYVALTRAERELRITWAEARTFGERTATREPSPYLREVAAAVTEPGAGPAEHLPPEVLAARPARRAGVRAAGTRVEGALDDLDDPGRAVYAALRAWRAGVARGSAVAEHAVLPDDALLALARLRPTDEDELAAVPGLGPAKVSRFGPVLLELVGEQVRSVAT